MNYFDMNVFKKAQYVRFLVFNMQNMADMEYNIHKCRVPAPFPKSSGNKLHIVKKIMPFITSQP